MTRPTRHKAAVIGRTGRGDYGHGLDLAVRDHPALKLVAVADGDPAGLEAATKRLGVDRGYRDYAEMLDREKPRFVAVAPRWIDQHRPMIEACAARGIHVFSEKPLAPSPADGDAIADACHRSHTRLAIAFQTRYAPRFDRVKALIADGAIGTVLEVRGRGKEDRRGGGEDLLVLGSHIVDLLRALLGPPSWCSARVLESGRPAAPADVRPGPEGLGPIVGDRIDATYGFADTPALAFFASARPGPGDPPAGNRFGLEILGTKGAIRLGFGAQPPAFVLIDPSWSTAGNSSAWRPIVADDPEPPFDLHAANLAIVTDLIRSADSDPPPRAGLAEAVGSIDMLLACHSSHIQERSVSLPLADRRHPLAAWSGG